MTDEVPEKPHFNPPLSAGKVRADILHRRGKFKDWVYIDVFKTHETEHPSDQAVARRRSNGEMKKWCVDTTHYPWAVIQQQYRVYDTRKYHFDTTETHTIFCFENSGEASFFKLAFGGDIIKGTLKL